MFLLLIEVNLNVRKWNDLQCITAKPNLARNSQPVQALKGWNMRKSMRSHTCTSAWWSLTSLFSFFFKRKQPNNTVSTFRSYTIIATPTLSKINFKQHYNGPIQSIVTSTIVDVKHLCSATQSAGNNRRNCGIMSTAETQTWVKISISQRMSCFVVGQHKRGGPCGLYSHCNRSWNVNSELQWGTLRVISLLSAYITCLVVHLL